MSGGYPDIYPLKPEQVAAAEETVKSRVPEGKTCWNNSTPYNPEKDGPLPTEEELDAFFKSLKTIGKPIPEE
jgi:hypothetical protein